MRNNRYHTISDVLTVTELAVQLEDSACSIQPIDSRYVVHEVFGVDA